MKSIALLWNRGMRPLSIIACLVLEHKGKSRSSALTGNSDWTGSWGDLGGVWHLALPFDEYFRKFWYPHLQWFQRSTDNCGKIHVRIILGHPIWWWPMMMTSKSDQRGRQGLKLCVHVSVMGYYRFINFHQNRRGSEIFLGDFNDLCTRNERFKSLQLWYHVIKYLISTYHSFARSYRIFK